MLNEFKNWRYFLKEDINHNLNYFLNFEDPQTGNSIYGAFDIDEEELEEIVSEIPVLHKNTIKSYIGGEYNGMVFELDNDHVLKLFVSGQISPERDFLKFKKMHDRQFKGIANRSEPAIYDLGVATTTTDFKVFYVEMGKVLPVEKWILMNHIDVHQFNILITDIGDFLESAKEEGIVFANSREAFKGFREENSNKYEKIPIPIMLSLFKSFMQFSKNYDLDDIHTGNFGVILPRNHNEPPNFVFFDV